MTSILYKKFCIMLLIKSNSTFILGAFRGVVDSELGKHISTSEFDSYRMPLYQTKLSLTKKGRKLVIL